MKVALNAALKNKKKYEKQQKLVIYTLGLYLIKENIEKKQDKCIDRRKIKSKS